MSLDLDNQKILDMMKAAGHPPVNELQPDEARKMYRASRGALQPELPDVAELRDLSAASDIPLRLYRGIGTRTGPLPVLVFYHGGGYVIGDLDTHDYVCRKIANVARCCVIAVDYRLAPEHKFPAAVEDAAAALHWIVQEAKNLSIDPSCVAVGGDSAGGNLSANMAHLSRDGEVPPLCFQMLLYPGTDMSMSQPFLPARFHAVSALDRGHRIFHRPLPSRQKRLHRPAGRPAPGGELQATRPCLRIDCGLRPARRRRNGLCPQAGGQ